MNRGDIINPPIDFELLFAEPFASQGWHCAFCFQGNCGARYEWQWERSVKIEQPCPNYAPKLMVVGGIINTNLSHHDWNKDTNLCPMCLSPGYPCGFQASWRNAHLSLEVEAICKNYLRPTIVVGPKRCTCDILALTTGGCKCGGV